MARKRNYAANASEHHFSLDSFGHIWKHNKQFHFVIHEMFFVVLLFSLGLSYYCILLVLNASLLICRCLDICCCSNRNDRLVWVLHAKFRVHLFSTSFTFVWTVSCSFLRGNLLLLRICKCFIQHCRDFNSNQSNIVVTYTPIPSIFQLFSVVVINRRISFSLPISQTLYLW